MGEIADMMLDGTLCERCGGFLDAAIDVPLMCAGCADEARAQGESIRDTGLGGFQVDHLNHADKPKGYKVKCPQCGKKVKAAGLADHERDVHGTARRHE